MNIIRAERHDITPYHGAKRETKFSAPLHVALLVQIFNGLPWLSKRGSLRAYQGYLKILNGDLEPLMEKCAL